MKFVRWCFAFLCVAFNTPAMFGNELQQPAAPEPTVPGITVTPNRLPSVVESDPGVGNGYNFSSNDSNFDGSPIDWNSGAIASDSTRVGPYNQPAWTTQRPYATSRVYVLPEGTSQIESWVRPTWKKNGTREYRFLEEYAIGLPGRFQLDIYERWNVEKDVAHHEGVQLELRYALADWGELPLNPTLYAEWIERGGPQEKPNKYELKLLLGDEITECLFFATNFILEQETSDTKETELQWSCAFSTPIIERKLMAGVEMLFASATVEGARDNPESVFMIGPSLQYRPTNRTFVDVVGLFGATKDSPEAQMYIVCGYQFGQRAGPNEISRPSSARGN